MLRTCSSVLRAQRGKRWGEVAMLQPSAEMRSASMPTQGESNTEDSGRAMERKPLSRTSPVILPSKSPSISMHLNRLSPDSPGG